MLEKAIGVGVLMLKAERVNGVGASLENGIVGLLVSFDVVNTGFGSVAGGCGDFLGV